MRNVAVLKHRLRLYPPMTFMVPFEGSRLARSALAMARLYAIALEEAPNEVVDWLLPEQHVDVVAVSIIPQSARYAREMGWIRDDEEFSNRTVVEKLHRQVVDIVPSGNFQYVRVDGYASSGTISTRLRQKAEELEASVLFIGSENAGRIITPLSSVGGNVTADQDYHVFLVRKTIPEQELRRLKLHAYAPGKR